MSTLAFPLRSSTARCALAAALTASALLVTSVAQAQNKPERLASISKTTTLVAYSSTGAVPVGMSEQRLRTLLELRLRAAGLRVLTDKEDEQDPDLNPYVMLRVSSLETKNRNNVTTGFTYRLDLSTRVFADSPINKSRAPLELFYDSTMGVSSQEETTGQIEQMVNQLADSLLNVWLQGNPRR